MDSSASTPLADYFWIAGVESISYQDHFQPSQQPQQVEETIEEHGEPDETESTDTQRHSVVLRSTARHSRQSSTNRLSKLSIDNRFSISTLDDLDGNTQSNRSSTTIKAPTQALTPTATSNPLDSLIPTSPNGTITGTANGTASGLTTSTGGTGLMNNPDFDFDQMLVRFAAERENFLEDLSFSAGAKLHTRPPMINPRAEKIKADDMEASGRRSPLGLRSIKGSIRRKLSFRDMNSNTRINSVRKTPSAARAGM